ncbi:MAG: hypothetical protein ACOYMD_15120 [Paludibacter sp.]
MKTKRNLYSVLTMIIFALLFVGSATTRENIPSRPIGPTFRYTIPTNIKPDSSGIKIALISPTIYAGAINSERYIDDFKNCMNNDLKSIIAAKGYQLAGEFDTFEYMTYEDKKNCELALQTEINMDLRNISGKWEQNVPSAYLQFAGSATYYGKLDIVGKVNFFISESYTKQRLLIKSYSINMTDLNFKSTGQYPYGTNGPRPVNDMAIIKVVQSLTPTYNEVLNQVWNMLNSDDVKRVKAQCPQIRKDGGFIMK